MRKVILYSLLLVAGLVLSQFLPSLAGEAAPAVATAVRLLTMTALGFIMIHVGYEFELDRKNPGKYGWDYAVAATAAAFPWLFCAAYFVAVVPPAGDAGSSVWQDALFAARFASPTSAGVLFSMLAAAGLASTWMFRKARVLAIFDDLDTILLMIPLKIMMVGFKWQLAVIVAVIFLLLWIAWKKLHSLRIPLTWPWVAGYAAGITAVCEAIYLASKVIDRVVPIHLEVLLPAFVLGCIMARPAGTDPHAHDARPGHELGPDDRSEQTAAAWISAAFMVLVGLSMPPIVTGSSSGTDWGTIGVHVLLITLLSNLGKMFPAFCYRGEATLRERLALCIGMFPRGEVGAGVLVVSISYGIGGDMITVAALSLALNLLMTGLFIAAVKRLLNSPAGAPAVT